MPLQRKKTFNWEDSDLLKTAARQVAAFLEQMNASKALAKPDSLRVSIKYRPMWYMI